MSLLLAESPRQCTKCGDNTASHKQYWCNACKREYARIYRLNNPISRERQRNQELKSKFGITLDDYNNLSEKQNHLCAICFGPETATSKLGDIRFLSVDHCHRTGRVRGLLCARCNTALGQMNDDPVRMRNAAIYLERQP